MFVYRERGREGEREGEKHRKHQHPPRTGDLACNLGMCSDRESNWRPFGLWDDTQPTEPHQSGHNVSLCGFLCVILSGEISKKTRWEEETHWSLRLMPMRWLLTGGSQSQKGEFGHLSVVSLMSFLEHLSSPCPPLLSMAPAFVCTPITSCFSFKKEKKRQKAVSEPPLPAFCPSLGNLAMPHSYDPDTPLLAHFCRLCYPMAHTTKCKQPHSPTR